MHERYINAKIGEIWSNRCKLGLWLRSELMLIQARAIMGHVPQAVANQISTILMNAAIDIDWWLARDKEINHDLNAFLDERLRLLPTELHQYFHKGITSYDTEESAFVQMLKDSGDLVYELTDEVMKTLKDMAFKYRYTIMYGRTHGQEAKLQTFGYRCLRWYQDLMLDKGALVRAFKHLEYSKMSGAIGNYGEVSPELEAEALKLMDLRPYYGASQILPRELFVPLASALCQLVGTLNKIALAIRLGARSGERRIFQEPFGKKQKGSSAMPHKKNTIATEQIEGLFRMASGYLAMIVQNIATWEERAIEQSSVERVAWPDLFHVTCRALSVMNKVLSGLVVFRDNMFFEVVESRGVYASDEAKEFLKEALAPLGFGHEDAYRIVQLAATNAFVTGNFNQWLADCAGSYKFYDELLEGSKGDDIAKLSGQRLIPISSIICMGHLQESSELEIPKEKVLEWNRALLQVFSSRTTLDAWFKLFKPSYLLRHEPEIFKKVFGDDDTE